MSSRESDYARARYDNLLVALVEQASGVEEVKSYPIGLVLDPSSACNLRCPMCPVSYEEEVRTKAILRWDTFERIIDELGPYLFWVDFFNWGEPLLNGRLPQMVAKLKQWNIEVRISSSLSVQVPDSVLESLIENEIDCLTVSIDGFTQEVYEKYRVRGNLQLALGNMQRLVELKRKVGATRPIIDWQYLVFSFNEHEVEPARRFARSIGVRFRTAAPYVDTSKNVEWLSSSEEHVREIYMAAWREREASRGSAAEPRAAVTGGAGGESCSAPRPATVQLGTFIAQPKQQTGTTWPSSGTGNGNEAAPRVKTPSRAPVVNASERMNDLSKGPPQRCDWHYLVTTINANGTVSPCCGVQEEHHDFGVLRGSFHEVWNNAAFRQARRFFGTKGFSKLADPKGLVCYECPIPDDQGRADGAVEDILRKAPRTLLRRAREVLPPRWTSKLPRGLSSLWSVRAAERVLRKLQRHVGQRATSSVAGHLLPRGWRGEPAPVPGGTQRDTLFAIEVQPEAAGALLDLTIQDRALQFESGFHARDAEAGLRWMSDRGRVKLLVPSRCEHLLVQGIAPKENVGPGGLEVVVRSGHAILATLSITRPGDFLFRVPIPAGVASGFAGQIVTLELESSRSFVSADLGTSKDAGRLAIGLKRIGFVSRPAE